MIYTSLGTACVCLHFSYLVRGVVAASEARDKNTDAEIFGSDWERKRRKAAIKARRRKSSSYLGLLFAQEQRGRGAEGPNAFAYVSRGHLRIPPSRPPAPDTIYLAPISSRLSRIGRDDVTRGDRHPG
jgi:hypothetical protein